MGYRSRWLIDPRKSKYIGYWDVTTGVALLFTAIVTPWEVAFAQPPDTALESMFLFNRFIDSIFVFDMAIQFRLIYQVGSTSAVGARWEDDPRMIAKHYLSTWFGLDVISILPFDVLSIVASKAFANLKIFRLFRLMRLIKLVRLIRASRMFKRWEVRMSINYGTLALTKSVVLVCIGAHWFACTWKIQAAIFFDSPLDTWMGYQGYCVPVNVSLLPDEAQEGHLGHECVDAWVMYTASLYFAVMTITSIGYGDIHATPQNAPEQGVALVLMLSGAMVWAHVIATFAGVVATLNPQQTEFRRTMDALNSFMGSQDFPQEMKRRLREYFHQSKHLQESSSQQSLLSKMSPQLAGEVALKCNERWLQRVWFLENAGQEFVVQIAMQLQAVVLTIGEVASSGFLYIINRGLALYGGRILMAGAVWGEDMILESQWLMRKYCARAMTYLEVYTISRAQLMAVARHFPETALHIRRCTIRLALRRWFILLAKERKKESEESEGRSASVIDRMLNEASTGVPPPALLAIHSSLPGPNRRLPTTRSASTLLGASVNVSVSPGRTARPREDASFVATADEAVRRESARVAESKHRIAQLEVARQPSAAAPSATDVGDVRGPNNQTLAAQLAKIEAQQAQLAEQMVSLQAGMETLLGGLGRPVGVVVP